MPINAYIMCIAALYSFISVFIPMFEVRVQSMKMRTYSLLTLITSPRIYTRLRSGTIDLNFLGFGVWVFVITLIISVAALTLTLAYQLYTDNTRKKKLGCVTVMILFIARIVMHVVTMANFITPKMLEDNNLTESKLTVTQPLTGNILIVVLFIGIVACLYGALNVKMNMKLLSYPYMIWIAVFTILPLLLIFFTAFFEKTGSGYSFTLEGFKVLMTDRTIDSTFYGVSLNLQTYFSIFLRSIDYALWTTIGTLVISYPLAYIIAERTKKMHKSSSKLLMLFVLPMWMNTMLRTYAWRAFFGQTGVLNSILISLGAIDSPIMFLKDAVLSDIITKIVMINDFLPFMLLPVFSVIVKLDDNLKMAAYDLGASRVQTFFKVTFPLSLPGVISGIQMVFMPALTFFMIPDIMSEGSTTTIGSSVQSFVLSSSEANQQAGNVLSLLILVFVLITMGLLRNADKDTGTTGGMLL